MEPSLSRRERKKLETRQALLQAASILFREKGYSSTTVGEITDRADVAKGTFFNYFASKEALLDELSVWRVGQLRAVLDPRRSAPASPVARIKLLLRLLPEQAAHDMRLMRRAFASRLSHPPHRAKYELAGMLLDLVGEAQACGEIRADIEAELVSDLLHMLYFRRMVACCNDDGDPPSVAEFERIIDLLMDGLAGPDWRRA